LIVHFFRASLLLTSFVVGLEDLGDGLPRELLALTDAADVILACDADVCLALYLNDIDAINRLINRFEDKNFLQEISKENIEKLKHIISSDILARTCRKLENSESRVSALYTLGELGEKVSYDIVTNIGNLLEDKNMDVRIAALGALKKLSTKVDMHITRKIIPTLDDKEKKVRESALFALGEMKRSEEHTSELQSLS
jgi:HEAT repeat protein